MKRYSLLLLLIGMLSACEIMPAYTGAKFTKTDHVDIYYSFDEVKRDYTVMGRLQGHKYKDDVVKKNLSAYAERIGADAIVITGFDPVTYKENAVALKYKPR